MKLLTCSVSNFGSYKDLTIDFNNLGLSLLYGSTGSGKSTVPDMPAWILFGVTAKDGNADDVRSWKAPDETTTGQLVVELKPGETITVVRIRGKSNENDLYYVENDEKIRGKDLTETQKLLENRLGVSAEIYISASYFHEFASTGLFFISNAKARREVFQGISDLVLPTKLADNISDSRRSTKASFNDVATSHSKSTGQITQLRAEYAATIKACEDWVKKQEKIIQNLRGKEENFENEKASKIEKLETEMHETLLKHQAKAQVLGAKLSILKQELIPEQEILTALAKVQTFINELKSRPAKYCPTCKAPSDYSEVRFEENQLTEELSRLKNLKAQNKRSFDLYEQYQQEYQELVLYRDPYVSQIDAIQSAVNVYGEQLQIELKRENPYAGRIAQVERQIETCQVELDRLEKDISYLAEKLSALDQLKDLCGVLRVELLKNVVSQIETQTNRYLEKYFDAELRVGFTLTNKDSIDVQIHKNGYECVYKQLSKGQRQLLKLCFVVSVMQASSNQTGVHFDALFFDEALDGLDSSLKIKAFDLFSELSTTHGTVFLIDHAPEFQTLFDKRYHVSLVEDNSILEAENEE